MKNFVSIFAFLFFLISNLISQTSFKPTGEKFKNGEVVWRVVNNGADVGQFWPIHGLNLVTRETSPKLFEVKNDSLDIKDFQAKLADKNIVGVVPDGMTGGSLGTYELQGKCLAHGVPCGDGFTYNYAVLIVSPNGYAMQFTHMIELGSKFDSVYQAQKQLGGSIFFLPSVYRKGKFLDSQKTLDKVLVRRDTPNGEQIGVIVFNKLITYNEAREIVLGLDRPGKSTTTNICLLDGAQFWGQSVKETSAGVELIGTRDAKRTTAYITLY